MNRKEKIAELKETGLHKYSTVRSRKRRVQIADAFGRVCGSCGKKDLITINEFFEKASKGLVENLTSKMLEIDHIVPRKHGGSDDIDNLRLVCTWCNQSKGAKLTER